MTLPAVLPVVDISKGRKLASIPRDFVLPGLPAGKLAVMSAPGGTGKSFLLLELALAVASGEPVIAGIVPDAAGPTRYISFEEDETDIQNRLVALFQTFSISPPVETFFCSALEGENLPLVQNAEKNEEAVKYLENICEGMRLVILDPLSRLHSADENSNSEMKKVVQILISVAKKTRCAIIVAHHTSKSAVLNGQGGLQQSARGASCLVDDPRLVCTLSRSQNKKSQYEDEENDDQRLVLTWAKMNGCRPIKPLELVRLESGVIVAANGAQDLLYSGGMYE
ncbi:MAG: AAA family ATPase [Aminobacterium sp.]|uniref:AAA family ATPase n=1 Tax=Aminobacterium sp. TaxID=1872491 RepID=UPI002B1F5841|nr:AAA family ATPase [Aminobacterium sp.]MEA4876534.1 AAA family ATPase [Aminobacterium sp.]